MLMQTRACEIKFNASNNWKQYFKTNDLNWFAFLLCYGKVLLFLFKFLIIAFLDFHSFKSKFNF